MSAAGEDQRDHVVVFGEAMLKLAPAEVETALAGAPEALLR